MSSMKGAVETQIPLQISNVGGDLASLPGNQSKEQNICLCGGKIIGLLLECQPAQFHGTQLATALVFL